MRINPRDCLAVLDIAEFAGLNLGEHSFPSLASQVLSLLVRREVALGHLPERDGFEFLDRMNQCGSGNRAADIGRYESNVQQSYIPPQAKTDQTEISQQESIALQTVYEQICNQEEISEDDWASIRRFEKRLGITTPFKI